MSRIKKQSINEMPGLRFVKEKDLTEAIRKIIKEGNGVRCAVAYWGYGEKFLKDFKGKKEAKVLCDLLGSTNPKAIEYLRNDAVGKKNVRYLKNLHTKVYANENEMVVCSANYSENGLMGGEAGSKVEAGLLTTDAEVIQSYVDWFDKYFDSNDLSKAIGPELMSLAWDNFNRRARANTIIESDENFGGELDLATINKFFSKNKKYGLACCSGEPDTKDSHKGNDREVSGSKTISFGKWKNEVLVGKDDYILQECFELGANEYNKISRKVFYIHGDPLTKKNGRVFKPFRVVGCFLFEGDKDDKAYSIIRLEEDKELRPFTVNKEVAASMLKGLEMVVKSQKAFEEKELAASYYFVGEDIVTFLNKVK